MLSNELRVNAALFFEVDGVYVLNPWRPLAGVMHIP